MAVAERATLGRADECVELPRDESDRAISQELFDVSPQLCGVSTSVFVNNFAVLVKPEFGNGLHLPRLHHRLKNGTATSTILDQDSGQAGDGETHKSGLDIES